MFCRFGYLSLDDFFFYSISMLMMTFLICFWVIISFTGCACCFYNEQILEDSKDIMNTL